MHIFPLADELGGFGYLSATFNALVEVLEREENGQELKAIDFFLIASFPDRGACCPAGGFQLSGSLAVSGGFQSAAPKFTDCTHSAGFASLSR